MKKIVFIILMILPWLIEWGERFGENGFETNCLSRFSIGWFNDDGYRKYSDGVFMLSNSLFGTGMGVYSGTIYSLSPNNHLREKKMVHVSFEYTYHVGNGIYTAHTISMTKELGNEASEDEMTTFISPMLKDGGRMLSQINLLEGVRVAAGTTAFPRFMCTAKP